MNRLRSPVTLSLSSMRCTPCWLLIWQDQSTGYSAFFSTNTPETTVVLNPENHLLMRHAMHIRHSAPNNGISYRDLCHICMAR